MRLPDPDHSLAVLIGTGRYEAPNLADIPSARDNVVALASALTDPTLGCFSPERCRATIDAPDGRYIHHDLRESVASANDTLLVYLTGHGILDQNGNFYLALGDTEENALPDSALSLELIRDVFMETRAQYRVLIIDCSFADRAKDVLGGIDGTYVLTVGHNRLALEDQPYSTFTEQLVSLLKQGIPGEGELITLGALYRHLVLAMRNRSQPIPGQYSSGDIADSLRSAPGGQQWECAVMRR